MDDQHQKASGCAHCDAATSASLAAVSGPEGMPEGGLHRVRLAVAGVLFLGGTFFNSWLHATPASIAEYIVLISAYLIIGFPVLKSAAESLRRGRIFNEMFLMSVATIGAIVLHQLPEAVGVMLFYSVGEYLQDRAVGTSRKSIAALMDIRPETARVLKGEERVYLPPEQVEVGMLLEVLPGERIPLDGEVVEGSSFVDTASLTGESVPRRVVPGDSVLAGFLNDEGRLTLGVTKVFGQSAVARILELVESAASRKAPTEKFITRFAAVYTPLVVISDGYTGLSSFS